MDNSNYFKIIDKDIINFCDEARKIYQHVSNLDLTNYSLDDIIERPYAIQMSKNFLLNEGFDSINFMFNKSEFFTPVFRFFITGKEDGVDILPPHMDMHGKDGLMPAVINFPLINCNEQTITYWHKIIKGNPSWDKNRGGELESILASNVTPGCVNCEFDTVQEGIFYDNEPVLFRTSRWHSVVNTSQKQRVIASLMLNPLMLWEDLVLHFKENNII